MPLNYVLLYQFFRRAFREVSPRRKKVLRFLVVVTPLFILINKFCLLLDHLLFPGFRRVRVEKPVFIIGHARSGTSLMHRLMCADKENFSWVMMYELIVPSILQRKIIRGIARLDERFNQSRIANRIHAWEDRVFAKGRQMHPMNLDGPEEDEFLLTLTFYSGTVAMIFPYIKDLGPYSNFDDGGLPESTKRRVMQFYKRCVQRTLYLNGPGKIHLSKNPMFAYKIRALLETFPDARFVVLMRNPYETIPSILKMMSRNWKASDCSRDLIAESLQAMGDQSIRAYMHPHEVLPGTVGTPWMYVRYEELVEKPLDVVSRVYQKLDIPLPPSARAQLEAEQNRNRHYRAEHIYSLEEFGLTYSEIRASLAPLFEQFQWPSPEDIVLDTPPATPA